MKEALPNMLLQCTGFGDSSVTAVSQVRPGAEVCHTPFTVSRRYSHMYRTYVKTCNRVQDSRCTSRMLTSNDAFRIHCPNLRRCLKTAIKSCRGQFWSPGSYYTSSSTQIQARTSSKRHTWYWPSIIGAP